MPPAPLSGSVRIISLNRDELLARLRQAATRLQAEHPEVEQVRLFGSLARGDATGLSDIDILILLRHTSDSDPHRRILTFLPYFDLPRSTDVLVYTRSELERRLSERDRFAHRVWNESVPL
jgi:predicted nucleotidyltransferase